MGVGSHEHTLEPRKDPARVDFLFVYWLFLVAYTCSGFAGLVYEVAWTRLLTLYIGHTTAAASAVVAAFLGGLAVGASVGGSLVSTLTPRQSLRAYVALEIAVAACALLLPLELKALTPLLAAAYHNGDSGLLFPTVRLLACLAMVFVPAFALGATFPAAVRWFTDTSKQPARAIGALYAANTTGAAVGALLAGFTLIPAIGISGTTRVAVAASLIAAGCVWWIARTAPAPTVATLDAPKNRRERAPRKAHAVALALEPPPVPRWLPALVLGLTGFAALMHEIVWTRILALLMGPTTYAFAASLAAVIGGTAIGSAIGTGVAGRTRRPASWLTAAIGLGGGVTIATSAMAGNWVPRLVAQQMAVSSDVLDRLFQQGMLVAIALITPTALCMGAAFPLAMALTHDREGERSRRAGFIYGINTVGAVLGSLAAGFVFLPLLGLQWTLNVVSACIVAAAAGAAFSAGLSSRNRLVAGGLVVASATAIVFSPGWNRELLASGSYLYAPYVPKDLDLETLLGAGTLLYYGEGASSTVSVKRLTGTTTLAVDGKVDASNRSDMLTQNLVAHLPLLLHDDPQQVAVIGLGSGVTLGAALRHPIVRADVIEISPEVVEASKFFAEENHHALDDPRTHLIVGDGRSHVLLADRQYDVIVSEPSNPWIVGVAALFTREFFEAARARLAPGGLICQWAHTYNIAEADLRSIVATFTSVFPNATMWLIGGDDILMIAGAEPLDDRLPGIERHWQRPGVAADLAEAGVQEPFSVLSLYAGGPKSLAAYGQGAATLTDDRMTLEFSGPRELHRSASEDNSVGLRRLAAEAEMPPAIARAKADATASAWRKRAQMLVRSDMHSAAYDDFVRALTLDIDDRPSLDGIVREALLGRRVSDALSWVRGLAMNTTPSAAVRTAISKLYAANAMSVDALIEAREAAAADPSSVEAREQIASLLADAGDATALAAAVEELRRVAPDRAVTYFYGAVVAFLNGKPEETITLGRRAIAADASFAPVHDLVGAAHTKLGQLQEARDAFLTSLRFDAHDSTAYANLGLIELAAGDRAKAAGYFAEALSLAPESPVARQGLAQATSGS